MCANSICVDHPVNVPEAAGNDVDAMSGASWEEEGEDAAVRAAASSTFEKGLRVLRVFDAARPALTISEVARAAGLDRAVARRLLYTLVSLGYVRRSGRHFSLTPRVLVLAAGFLEGHRFGKTIQPILRAYARDTDEGISVAMLDGEEGVYVAHAGGSPERVTLGFTVGSRIPLAPTAIGRALLLAVPPAEASALLARIPVARHTARTVTDRAAIEAALERARAAGYARADEEFEPAVGAVAVPVVSARGTPSAVGLSADIARFSDPAFERGVVATLRECAAGLAAFL